MSPAGEPEREPVRLERVRAPWWRGGGFRLRRERPRVSMPAWARIGLRLPGWTVTATALICALVGGVVLALLFGPAPGR